MTIRWMIRNDLPQVMAIENASFDQPWDEAGMVEILRQPTCIGMVAEYGDTICGFFVYDLRRNGLELLNIAVHPDYRRKGVGQAMLNKVATKLGGVRKYARTCVMESNLAGHRFFSNSGWRCIGIERGRYGENSDQDAYVFELRLASQSDVVTVASRVFRSASV